MSERQQRDRFSLTLVRTGGEVFQKKGFQAFDSPGEKDEKIQTNDRSHDTSRLRDITPNVSQLEW